MESSKKIAVSGYISNGGAFKLGPFNQYLVLLASIASLSAAGYGGYWLYQNSQVNILKLNQEDIDAAGTLLNPSTQSINRPQSVLQDLDEVKVNYLDLSKERMSFTIFDRESDKEIYLNDIDISFMVPILPYQHEKTFDEFDRANLMLGEFSRSGIELSFQEKNDIYGYFNASNGLFNEEEEYTYANGAPVPNKNAKPIRFGITNNCLKAGLWELSARDSVGEMYHSWFPMELDLYYSMIKEVNNLEISDFSLSRALKYKRDLEDVLIDLDRLRETKSDSIQENVYLNVDKKIGSYSTQESRRKSQRKYFAVRRSGEIITASTFRDLKVGDDFVLRAFINPGIYSAKKDQIVPFDPFWESAEIREVIPKTKYKDSEGKQDPLGYLEVTLYKPDKTAGVVAGNIPISLLVEQEDYLIPGFGVGILPPSETIEQRYLRVKDGPSPYYAYQFKVKDGEKRLVNNHEVGIEQVALRAFKKNGQIYLSFTLVSYERILDLVEVFIPLSGETAEKVEKAIKQYEPPLYRVYEDNNLI